ncbi:DUF1444 family protein [Brevibacillus ginsengisoli]|uniref:DUF1444 family protein n=1 Tax=Brevibacillus ginsengisoli TaxID=363854 RepID=UPI003CF83FC5
MSANELNRIRVSLQRRVIELLERELSAGWECRAVQQEILLVSNATEQPMEIPISLENLYQRVESYPEQRREALYSFVSHIVARLNGLLDDRDLKNQENHVYPVLRHISFTSNHPQNKLVTSRHTSESVVLYAVDYEKGYRLIDQTMLEDAGWSKEQLHEYAMRNLRKLPFTVRTQVVAGNTIHFISPRDGFAASRVLMTELLDQYDREKKGKTLGVAIPHQDVLIVVDIQDESGMQLLSRLTYDFASKGDVPITPFPFFYENQSLESYIIVQHAKKEGQT